MKKYLNEKIKLGSTEIGHTYQGIIYLVDHYSHILSRVNPNQISEQDRQHLQDLIERLKFHQHLYETYGKHLIDAQERDNLLQHPSGDTPDLRGHAEGEEN